jgi:hypothetical protein
MIRDYILILVIPKINVVICIISGQPLEGPLATLSLIYQYKQKLLNKIYANFVWRVLF